MRTETEEMVRRHRERYPDLDPLEATALVLAAAQESAPASPPPSPTQPSLELTTRLFTMTEAELHDLTYHAVTSYLGSLRGLRNQQVHLHAGRIAAEAVRRGLTSDYLHEGVDPRA